MIVGIIPARFASTRLMGKPLADIGGKPMIQHTYESASKSRLIDKIVLAVDDEKIMNIAKKFGAQAFMTPSDLPSGSDRIAFVAKKLDADIIVNIQGDEPFIQGKMIDQAIEPLLFDKDVEVSTLIKKITKVEELKSNSIPKVVFDYNNFALYFSRSPIPFVRDAKTNLDKINIADIYKHIGLYVYRKNALLKFTSLKPTDLENIEKLEQLRMLENGMKIKVVTTEFESLSVDTQKDLEVARKYFLKNLRNKSK
jgi:3-deoxy-manno-octulosonate cytidylyltransferase (CMP-KDO synthetase)